eukprot:Skav231545  [mRNA]  locus=scaffold84:769601:770347:- [translate_table: standard]
MVNKGEEYRLCRKCKFVFTRSSFTQHSDRCKGKRPSLKKAHQRGQGKVFARGKEWFLKMCAEKFDGGPFTVTCGCTPLCLFDRLDHPSEEAVVKKMQEHFLAARAISPEEALRLQREKEKLEAHAAKVEEEKKGLEEEKKGLQAEAKLKSANGDFLQMTNEIIQKDLMEQEETRREMERRHHLKLEEVQSSCVVCKVAKPSVHFQPCKHMCTCRTCWEGIQKQKGKEDLSLCPICRQPVGFWLEAFLS